MDRRFDGGSAYFQRADNHEEYGRQRDWGRRGGRENWDHSVDRFLDTEERRPRERSPRDRSRERERGRERRRSSSRERRYRGSPPMRSRDEDRYDRNDRSRNWGEDEGRRGHKDRRSWDDGSPKERDFNQWSEGQSSGQGRDKWLETVWGKQDGYESSSSYNNDSQDGRSDWSDLPPGVQPMQNRTIIIRGLAQHITENDLRQEIAKSGQNPSDIRMIRRKNGTSRGFAFVEFPSTEEAVKCLEANNGELMLNNHYRAIMQFSMPKDARDRYYSDWHCKCSAHNFKRRDVCYKCGCSRESALADEVSSYPTNTVLLRGLDTLTTESNVLESIQDLSNLPIKSVRIGRDPVTNTSLGVCYIEMNYVMDATFLHNALLMAAPDIDGKVPLVSYYKSDPASQSTNAQAAKAGNIAVEAAQWSHQKTGASDTNQYTLKDVPRLAEYSANLYAKTPEEKTTYLAYYTQYYNKLISDGEQISLPADAMTGNPSNSSGSTSNTEAPDGAGTKTYSVPDVSTYQYDKTSGYYYDPQTTLYYDANSQYYYNSKLTKFLYWDSSRNTYLPAPTAATTSEKPTVTPVVAALTAEHVENGDLKDDDKKIRDKTAEKDKVKVAKRIAKDMEKWAKTLNQKKEVAKQNLVTAAAINTANLKTQGAADIGFAVLERKDISIPSGMAVMSQSAAMTTSQQSDSLVAAYGAGSDSEAEEEETVEGEEKQHVDWVKLACLLCKRQFPSKEVLIKHQTLSDLHKKNLENWYNSRGLDPEDAQKRTLQYRDRAKERRLKYGEPDKPQPNRLKETYMKSKEASISYEEPTKMGIGSDNLGNKLLQKMGWQEGMGLGKKNQGRTTIIEAKARSATAGLGTKSTGVVPGPGETYKDCVRKMMYLRYQEIDENNS